MPSSSEVIKFLQNNTLLIWDDVGVAPNESCTVLYWQEYAESHNKADISIVNLVEKNRSQLKRRYLSWIHDLGEHKVDGKSVKDHLIINPGFSFWWASSLAQKFNISSESKINDAIKVLALEDFIKKNNIKRIVVASSNDCLVRIIKNFCCEEGLNFELRREFSCFKKRYSLNFLSILPDAMMATMYLLRHMIRTFHVELPRKTKNSKEIANITFVDVLVHLDKSASNVGKFESNYWTSLVNTLIDLGIKSNWVHIFFEHSLVPSIRRAGQLINEFNVSRLERHSLLERPIGVKSFLEIATNYISLCKSFKKLNSIGDIRPAESSMNLWFLHKRDWRKSLCGISAIDTCLKLAQFLEIFGELPSQRLGIYIAENQPWELALIHAWRVRGHKYLIGVPHTTIRYWDLRYFNDFRCYLDTDSSRLPMPDAFAVNGPVAYEALLSEGYPKNKLLEVEALRFLYLNEVPKTKKATNREWPLRILVCGDFLEKTSKQILAWLNIAAKSMPPDTKYIFKPHPAYPVNFKEFININIKVDNRRLIDLFKECDVVLAGNITSASVDAYFFGAKVIQILDGNSFNSSPLLGFPNVTYVKSPAALVEALLKSNELGNPVGSPKSYFHLDNSLSRWKEVLGFNLVVK